MKSVLSLSVCVCVCVCARSHAYACNLSLSIQGQDERSITCTEVCLDPHFITKRCPKGTRKQRYVFTFFPTSLSSGFSENFLFHSLRVLSWTGKASVLCYCLLCVCVCVCSPKFCVLHTLKSQINLTVCKTLCSQHAHRQTACMPLATVTGLTDVHYVLPNALTRSNFAFGMR